MTRGGINEKVALAKVALIEQMLDGINGLPLDQEDAFLSDPRNPASGESFLRRALEALLDLGRHVLAKGFGIAATEYKAVPKHLREQGILDADLAEKLTRMAGYRNRMVHFYDEVTPTELFGIFQSDLGDLEGVLDALRAWIGEHLETTDGTL